MRLSDQRVAIGQPRLMFQDRVGQFPLGVGHRSVGLCLNVRDLALRALAQPRHLSGGFLGERIGFSAVLFGLLRAGGLGPCCPFGVGGAPFGFSDLRQRIAVGVLDFCAGRFDVAGFRHSSR